MTELQKSQLVRLWDILVFGPAMIYIGYTVKNLSKWQKWFLLLGGYGTIYYNGKNYLINRELIKQGKIEAAGPFREVEK